MTTVSSRGKLGTERCGQQGCDYKVINSRSSRSLLHASSSHRRMERIIYKIVVLVVLSVLLFPCVAFQHHPGHNTQSYESQFLDDNGGVGKVRTTTTSSSNIDQQQRERRQPTVSTTTVTPPTARPPYSRHPFLVVCTVDGNIHVLQASDGSPVCLFKSGTPLVTPSVPISSSGDDNDGEDAHGHHRHHYRIIPGLDGRLYVSDDGDDGILRPLDITVVDVLKNPVQTCRTSAATAPDDLGVDGNDNGEPIVPTNPAFASTTHTKVECGIITATKTVSLFAVDSTTGLLVWQQFPNGTTTQIEYDDEDQVGLLSLPTSGGRTVLLQREDITVQQIDTNTGKSVWNVSLGTQQALDFGGDSYHTAASSGRSGSRSSSTDSPPPNQRLLPSGRSKRSTSTASDLIIDEYREELPYVMFSQDGKRLTAVSPTAASSAKEIWGHDFSTVVASVFGLDGRSWRPLTVLDNDDDTDDDEKLHRHLLPDSPSELTMYKPQYANPLIPFSMEQLYDGIDWLLRLTTGLSTRWQRRSLMTSQDGRVIVTFQDDSSLLASDSNTGRYGNALLPNHRRTDSRKHLSLLELPSPSDKMPGDKMPNHGNSFSPPNILMTHSGVFLTFPVIFGIVFFFILGVILGTRFVYKRKKAKWMKSEQLSRVSFRNNRSMPESDSHRRSVDATIDGIGNGKKRTNAKAFFRSHSVPGTMDEMNDFDRNGKTSIVQNGMSTDMLLSSPQLAHSTTNTATTPKTTTDGDDAKSTAVCSKRPQRAESTPPPSTPKHPATAKRTETSSTEASFSMIDGSIPLIRYTRYASEFVELAALGKGGFGSVFQCRNALDGREYAIKKVLVRTDAKVSQEEFSRRLQRTLREVKSLALLDHPNIVRYYTAWLEQANDGDSHVDHLFGSEYYLTTPTKDMRKHAERGFGETSQSWSDRRGSSGSGFLSRRFSVGDSSRGGSQSIVGGSLSTSNGVLQSDRDIQGIPGSLDDYGFVFDRSDDQDSTDKDAKSNPTRLVKDGQGNEDAIPLNGSPNDEKFDDLRRRKDRHLSTINRRAISFQSMSNSSDLELSESRNQSGGKRDEYEQNFSQKTAAKSDGDPGSEQTLISRKYILYIQMQFCSQKTIGDFLSNEEARRGPAGNSGTSGVDIPYALNLFLQIAMGVRSVHFQGLIHRDLKPNNCFVDDAGVVKVGDFGLSRESSDSSGEFQGGIEDDSKPITSIMNLNSNRDITVGVGTRSYASPEQMKGGSDYDSSTDIYSLGIILFEMCYPMYTGMERNIVLSNLRKHIFPDTWMSDTVPEFPTLHQLLVSMISNDPGSRPTAEEVVDQVQSILEAFTVSSLDKKHHDGAAILLRIETLPREDVLRHTMELVKEAALPEKIQIVQYGLRGGENKQIMEFAVVPDVRDDGIVCCKTGLGNRLVNRLREDENVLLIRQVRPRSTSADDGK